MHQVEPKAPTEGMSSLGGPLQASQKSFIAGRGAKDWRRQHGQRQGSSSPGSSLWPVDPLGQLISRLPVLAAPGHSCGLLVWRSRKETTRPRAQRRRNELGQRAIKTQCLGPTLCEWPSVCQFHFSLSMALKLPFVPGTRAVRSLGQGSKPGRRW